MPKDFAAERFESAALTLNSQEKRDLSDCLKHPGWGVFTKLAHAQARISVRQYQGQNAMTEAMRQAWVHEAILDLLKFPEVLLRPSPALTDVKPSLFFE